LEKIRLKLYWNFDGFKYSDMSAYFHSYHQSATIILEQYRFQLPFAVHLKSHFKKNKKFGSRDRKTISDLCYGFLRLGNAGANLDFQDRMATGYFLTHNMDNGYLQWCNFPFIDAIHLDCREKLEIVTNAFPEFNPLSIFPEIDQVTPEIERLALVCEMLKQPDFFLRVRPGYRNQFVRMIKDNTLPGEWVGEDAIRVNASFDVADKLEPDLTYVVQDISSQRTFKLLDGINLEVKTIWDACSGSGGKTLMAFDRFPGASIFASDIREEILVELKRRSAVAGIKRLKVFCNDLQHPMSSAVTRSNLPQNGVDLIIADVPCTGSGTWARSPEWLQVMDLETINAFQERQSAIVRKLASHLKRGGYLLYITCSVYVKENQEITDQIQKDSGLVLLKSSMIIGTETGGDYLYAALFTSQP
jgi:16S rRNA (cytosine967-C5)-methyltransferase